MKIGRILGLIFICIIFSLFGSKFCFADRPSGASIYQAFINELVTNHSEVYANYLSNGSLFVFDVELDTSGWYNYSDGYFGNTNLRRNKASDLDNKKKGDGSLWVKYIAFLTKPGFTTVKPANFSNAGIVNDQEFTFWNKPASASGINSTGYKIMLMDNAGKIYYSSTYSKTLYIGGTSALVWADENVTDSSTGDIVYTATTSNYIPNTTFDFNGNWENYELYEYVVSYISNNYNLYATGWADGSNPSCMIFDNLRGNIKANRLNNSFLPDTANGNNGIDYLCVFYPDRFCCYHDEENHDYYFNFFSLNLPFFYITITKATQSIQFYYMDLAYNNTTPVAQIHYEYPESLIFTNKNIIAKSNANDFIMDGANFTWWRATSYERKANPSITPVSPDSSGYAGISVDTSTIESNQGSIIDKITGFFSGFFDTVKNAITSVFDFVGDTILSLWNTIKNQILSKLPVFWISDFLNWIQAIYQNAITRSQNLDFIYHFTFLNKNIDFDPLVFYKSNKIYVDKFINLGLILGLVFYNIRQIFVILKGGKQG